VKAVADTNVIVSGLIWGGPPASLLDRAAQRFFHLVFRCAGGANAMAIITGDKDLLTMKEFAGIPIMTPRCFSGSIGQ
jgi:predicted nucleic acid-binding protein